MSRFVGSEFENYNEQQELWRILMSAGYKPRVIEGAGGPGLSNENWTVSCIGDDARSVLDEALGDVSKHYYQMRSTCEPMSDDYHEYSVRMDIVEKLREDLEDMPEC